MVEATEENLPSLSGISVLVLDDDPHVVRSLSRVLGGLGAQVIGVGSLREARLSLQPLSPDAVLADLQLKDGTGLELLSEYLGQRSDGERQHEDSEHHLHQGEARRGAPPWDLPC